MAINNCDEVLILMDKEVKLLNDALALLKAINVQQFNSLRGLCAKDAHDNSLESLFGELDDITTDVFLSNVAYEDDDEPDFYDEYEDEDEEEE